MELPPHLLQHVADWLPASNPDERRRSPRQRQAAWVQVTLCGRDAPPQGILLSATVWNISAGGAGIVLPQELRRDDCLILHLPHPEAGQTNILCRIAHCRSKAGGLFLIGLEFQRLLPERSRIPGPLPPLP